MLSFLLRYIGLHFIIIIIIIILFYFCEEIS